MRLEQKSEVSEPIQFTKVSYAEYSFRIKFDSPAKLPRFKGSMLRGVMGHGLSRVACLGRCREEDSCVLPHGCLFSNVFRGRAEFQHARVLPFVFSDIGDSRTDFDEGDELVFSITLFGDVQRYIPYLIAAIREGGKLGLGKKIDGRRGHYTLNEVWSGDKMVYRDSQRLILLDYEGQQLALTNYPELCNAVKISLLTPLRVKYKNCLATNLPFEVFCRALLRRTVSIFERFGTSKPHINFRDFIDRSKKIEIVENDLYWKDIVRYSNRQKREMRIGGLMGSILYEGDLSPFVSLVKIGSVLHVGKQTTFGLGRYDYKFL